MYWIALKTLARRECIVVFRFWIVTLAPPVIATILYFTVFGKIMGNRIGPIDGLPYDQFVTPGLIAMSVIPGAYFHTAAGLLAARVFGYIEELLVSPMPRWMIVVGYAIGGVLRGLMVAMTVAMVSLVFAHARVHSILASIATLLMAAVIAAVFGFIIGTFARRFEQVTTIQILILAPLTYIGGVFAPISTLPEWAQELSFANPMFHVVNALRYGISGVSDASIGASLSFIAALTMLLVILSMMVMAHGPGLGREPSNS
jgi:ABC-2 type transport system permease protein